MKKENEDGTTTYYDKDGRFLEIHKQNADRSITVYNEDGIFIYIKNANGGYKRI